MTELDSHSQPNSPLLCAPLEVRRAIYAHFDSQLHMFLLQGAVRLSPCLQPNLGDNNHAGHERRYPEEGAAEVVWARRLDSSWGPHWECEELAFATDDKPQNNPIYKLLFVCKRMFLEICDFVAERSVINITDLDTLDASLPKSGGLGSALGQPWSLFDLISPRIHNLNVTLRLPIAFYKAVETGDIKETAVDRPNIAKSIAYNNDWIQFWSNICSLQGLHNLHVWLDHDHESSWSEVKERPVLDPVFAILAREMQSRSSRCTGQHAQVLFNLPKLHPGIATPDTHFIEGTAPPLFTLQRRYRQRYHSQESPTGTSRVVGKADFPVMWELTLDENPDGPYMTLEEVEIYERGLWERGLDPTRELLEINGHMCFEQGYI
ncbi:hypothetical protein BKA65DRAFT_538906 [Rhexocercosporidium sp. MPI-PUGE-AT-0058]|nr:hypothetical protein BKA65DRAFT_538906 [Rhexocercosporidium sp. MPI-PUGE-AT-0058]